MNEQARWALLAAALLSGAGCGVVKTQQTDAGTQIIVTPKPDGGVVIVVPVPPISLPTVDVNFLPKLDAGWVLIASEQLSLEVDPGASDAITAAGACADQITYCVTAGQSVDTCVDRAPSCKTSTPWKESACCPAACKSAYTAARATAAPIRAFEAAFFETVDCHPGLRAALEVHQ